VTGPVITLPAFFLVESKKGNQLVSYTRQMDLAN